MFIWFPLYGSNLRFEIGSILAFLINFLGTFLMSFGGLISTAIMGGVMIWVGYTILGGVFMTGSEYEGVSAGYH